MRAPALTYLTLLQLSYFSFRYLSLAYFASDYLTIPQLALAFYRSFGASGASSAKLSLHYLSLV